MFVVVLVSANSEAGEIERAAIKEISMARAPSVKENLAYFDVI